MEDHSTPIDIKTIRNFSPILELKSRKRQPKINMSSEKPV